MYYNRGLKINTSESEEYDMKDMTQGKPLKLIIGFAIPMLIGNIFQQVYNVADTMIVGRYFGENALAGVGSTGTLTYFLLALVSGMCNGAGLVIAQCFGSGNKERLSRVVTALIWVAGALTCVVAVIGMFFSEFFLRLLKVPDDVIGYSVEYLHIIYTFVFGSVIYNGCGAILNSVGDSKTPLRAVIASSFVNIALDIFFIVKCNLGVAGAAYATIVAQCVSAAICFAKIIKVRAEIGLVNMKRKPEKEYINLIVRTGFPAAFQSCMISLGGMSVQRLINSFGSSVMAAYVAANRVDSVAIQVIVSIGNALSVFTGQNIGQNRYDRIKEALYKTLAVMVAASAFIAAMVLIFRVQLMKLFLDANESGKAIEIGCTYLTIIGVAYVIAGIMQSYQNVIRGAGDVNTCMVAGLTELSGRIVFAYLLSGILGVTGIWIATPLSWSCGCIIPVIRYYSGKWKNKKLA